MQKKNIFNQFFNVILEIIISFAIVFFLYFLTIKIDNFLYDYFIFPVIAIVLIFMCGVRVGTTMEKYKINEGIYPKKNKQIEKEKPSEFKINENVKVNDKKKVLVQNSNEEKVHIKVIDYDELQQIFDENNSRE